MVIWMVAFLGRQQAPVGIPATLLVMIVMMESTSLFGVSRSLARAASGGKSYEVDVQDDGITISSERNTNFRPWKVFSGIWVYDRFVILPLGPLVVSRFIWIPREGMSPEVLTALESAASRYSSGLRSQSGSGS